MPRKLRIQFEGALYHVINRGNYRLDLFESAGAAQAFEDTLIEACELSGWRLHAHVVMRNHYHLAVETPRANLGEGMHWLQATFATRFNRLRDERGALFQGRYHALLIEDMAALARVVDYIHLNPARASIVTPEQLPLFRWSSLRRFMRTERPSVFVCADWLAQHDWTDSPDGLRHYVDHLTRLASDQAEQKRLGLEKLSDGWAIGTEGWRKAIAKAHAQRALNPGLEAAELGELKRTLWSEIFDAGMKRLGNTREDAKADICRAAWKIGLAQELRKVGAPYAWITEQLHMGEPVSARVYLSQAKN